MSEVVGICGGYQMIGDAIEDPYLIESDGTPVKGLGLIGVSTVLDREKTLTRAGATHVKSGLPVSGYEIHHGITRLGDLEHAMIRRTTAKL